MVNLSSGNILADRRFEWARSQIEQDDLEGAADLLSQVLELVPDWAPAWAVLAEAQEGLGRISEALRAWGKAALLDRTGALGAELHSARLSGRAPSSMPSSYVSALFDEYAPRFERHLTEALGYRAPASIVAALDARTRGRRFSRALDLGCGTGLMARALVHRSAEVDGVDLSSGMIEQARRSGFYRKLEVGSLLDFLEATDAQGYDLVCAADVLVYCGDLGPVFAGVARALRPGGLFAFTVQAGTGDGPTFGADLRFAHGRDHINRRARTNGLSILDCEPASNRTEAGVDVPGWVVLAGACPPCP